MPDNPSAAIGSFYVLLLLTRALLYQLGFADLTAVMLAFVLLPAVLAPRAIVRGLAAGAFGVLFGTIGIDSITGEVRYVFGQSWLWEGLPTVPVVIGLLAIPWGLNLVRRSLTGAGRYSSLAVIAVAVAGGLGTAVALGQSPRSNSGFPTIGYYLF